jgi:ribonuclease Z
MTPTMHPTFVNGAFGDPALYLEFPAEFIAKIEHALARYSWNLVERYDTDLVFDVTEVITPSDAKKAVFRFRNAFRREAETSIALKDRVVLDEPMFRVRTTILDHRIPCLAFAVEETVHVNVWKNRLEEMGLMVGPWLRDLKRAVVMGEPDSWPVTALGKEHGKVETFSIPLGDLKRNILRIVPGQKIGYVVDAAFTEENIRRIVDLIRDADTLFIEAPFAGEEADLARDRCHLTTVQAGRIGRMAGVRCLEPFHFSPRHTDDEDRLRREVDDAFHAEARPCS